jgi:hypothetical protein
MTKEEFKEKYPGVEGEQAKAYLQGWCEAYYAAEVSPEAASAYILSAVAGGDSLLEAAIAYIKCEGGVGL